MFVDNESAFVGQERHGSAGAHLASAKTPCVYDLEHISVRFFWRKHNLTLCGLENGFQLGFTTQNIYGKSEYKAHRPN
jgi:hypothetical protein